MVEADLLPAVVGCFMSRCDRCRHVCFGCKFRSNHAAGSAGAEMAAWCTRER